MADAVYVDLVKEDGTYIALKDSLINHKNWVGEPDRVKLISEYFELLDFQPDTDSGFSGGLFRHLKGDHKGETIFASRGTAGVTDDIAIADVYGIVAMGIPQFQVRDLYNYVQKLKAPKDGEYRYLEDTFFEEFYLEFGTK